MFNYSDRFPTGTPLPQGHVTPAPWGLRHIAPYPGAAAPQYARVELDADTQTARYYNTDGTLAMAPGHGTSSGTNPSTGTGNPSDGSGPGGGGGGDVDTGNDTDQ
ncbi:putative ATP-grasp-modified RiPP [Streptantibioticus rubrisoli]|uniref:ATP-grasp-modified RiPP n=1 Tax=Streptantibioticus rubrisoli TaxID=1387313 RepID=A0ABT1PER9_9ACTN|nr:putative ATP-grasp-modified RiPP [Streptantibioticus rubrisoli]MCQ4043870.1 putative ATP-grasp-modified RiPP [Streptantibioticus rubrisoli]